ncbi:MAG: hydantoinase/oxoprolinase family protein [Alphaproteobacteria bacterium]|nr:hydantoinase/oxoprolinase family protein [Alphaproteobacteria bacterium]
MRYRLGVDIGGTFTDIVLYDEKGGTDIAKLASTPDDPGRAVVEGAVEILSKHDIFPSQISEIVHGTTVGSNTILQRVGAKTGLITTKGFRDILEIGRIRTPDMFDLTWEKPVQLVERRFRKEVTERLSADGKIVTPLDMNELGTVAQALADGGCEAIAICFLHSYVNPAHEIATREFLEKEFPQFLVTASCDVLPEMKEYERTSTTVVNAYLLTQMRAYLTNLESELKARGFNAPLLIVNSAGGMMSVEAAKSRPVFAVGSGPAGGVAGGARLAEATGLGTLIAFDMGGTTAKASIIRDGQPMLINEYEFREGISSPSRFTKGGGYMLKVPAIDIAEVGAGGGSIAWIDTGGMLQVGPISAGSNPGPASYGLGNEKPTVTDANIVLGYIGETGLAGGSLTIDKSLAEAAIAKEIAEPLQLSVTEAALGIRRIANVNMARAIRSVTVERGLDPREMALMVFGGGGALHGVDVAQLLGITKIIIPDMSGVFCSVGMLASDVEHSMVRATFGVLENWRGDALGERLTWLRDAMMARLNAEGFTKEFVALKFLADLRYQGQSSELTIPVDPKQLSSQGGTVLRADFEKAYYDVYGYTDTTAVELVNLRVTGLGIRKEKLDFKQLYNKHNTMIQQAVTKRKVCFNLAEEWHETPVQPRNSAIEHKVTSPIILYSYDTTIAVPPKIIISTDGCGSVILDIQDFAGEVTK